MMNAQFDFTDFTRIKVDGAVSIFVTQADAYSVKASGDNHGHLKMEKIGDTLRISRRFDWFLAPFHARPHVDVTMPELAELIITGASQGEARGFKTDREMILRLTGASHLRIESISVGSLKVEVVGASNLTGDINAGGDAYFRIIGASRAELSGTGKNAVVELTGASQARFSRLALNDLDARITGASSAFLKVNGKLDVELNGASRLEYSGSPTLGKVRVAGASTLKQV
jgi:hypothetical protein